MKKLLTLLALLGTAAVTSAQVTFTCTAGQDFEDSQGCASAFDGDLNTKWCKGTGSETYALVTASQAVYLYGYEFVTADDNQTYEWRTPQTWAVYGTNDASVATNANADGWVTLDSRDQAIVDNKNFAPFRFFCADTPTTAYKYFKVCVTKNRGAGIFQISEFKFCYTTYQYVAYNWTSGDNNNLKKVLDRDLTTKAEGEDMPDNVKFTIQTADGNPHTVKSYSMTTHDDGSWNNRAPKSWILEGSNDNSSWITIDDVTDGEIPNLNHTTKDFIPSDRETAVKYLRLTIRNYKGGYHQLAEFNVVGACETHDWVNTTYVAPTCVDEGGGEQQCTVCGATKITEIQPATGVHTYSNGYCTVCSRPDPSFMTANAGFYEPTTVAQFNWLAAMIQYGETVNIRLTQDVNLSGFGGFGNGSEVVPFAGEFDGQGHWIKNLRIDVGEKNTGFFGKTEGANLHDFGLLGAYVKTSWGNANAGGIVGNAKNTTINRVAVAKGSYVEGYDHVGALVGNTEGSTVITNCFSDADVLSGAYQAGGLVGTTNGLDIEKCLFTGSVSNNNFNSSGLVALIDSETATTTIKNNIVAASQLWVGQGEGLYPIVNTGGRVATYKNNRIAASMTFKAGDSEAVTRNYINADDSNGLTTPDADMKIASFYTSTMGWDMTNDWTFIAEGHYPVLKWMVDFISTPAELVAFANKVNNGGITTAALLTADVNMSGTPHASIGTTTNKFQGLFNGQGHTVTLNITSDQQFQGLIGCATGGTSIMNVITSGSVTGSAKVGGILGGSEGSGAISINNCGNEANITATGANAGGIHGCNNGSSATYTLINCYNAGTVSGGNESAGLSGWLGRDATVTNCYNIGDVTGIDGSNRSFARWDNGTYTNCYNKLNASSASNRIDNYPMDKVRSGELCVALGSAFTQDLSDANYPTFGSKTVNAGMWFNGSENDVYYNEEGGYYTVYQLNLNEENTKYEVPANVTAMNVSVDRSIPENQWIGLCLPFDYDIPSGWEVRELTGVSGTDESANMTFSTASSIVAGKPYIVKPTAAVTSITATDKEIATVAQTEKEGKVSMVGSFAKSEIPVGSFYINTSSQIKKLTGSPVDIKGFRAYFTVDGVSGVKALNFDFDDDATAIEMVAGQSSKGNGSIYNVAGQRISKMQKGINIVNGKKVLF